MSRFIRKNFFINYLYKEYIQYAVYLNLSYFWNFGVLSFSFLILQILTGIFLAMHYNSSADLAFLSIEHIMRDINFGWLLRYLHANGASFFFLCVYFHIFRNIFYLTFIKPRHFVWIIGMIIFILMILTAFLGYVSPWGQMSFRAATVITSLASVFPIYGNDIVIWLWGGFAVGEATLNRFLSLHYLLPFILLLLVFFHVLFLHEVGSSNPIGQYLLRDKIWFHPYYTRKDIFSCILFLIIFCFFIFFNPNILGHTDNYIMANSLVTPTHIVPEWYFLPFYAILRSIPNKAGGIFLLLFTLLLLIILPYIIHTKFRISNYDLTFQCLFWCFINTYIILGWLGGSPIEYPYIIYGQCITFLFLSIFLFLLNFVWEIQFLLNLNFWTKN